MERDSLATILKRALISAVGVAIGSWLLDGIRYETTGDLILVVALLGVFSAILKPILVLFTLPFVLLTFGLGLLLINALLYLLVGEIVPGFEVVDFWAAFWGALIITLLNVLFSGWISGGGGGGGVARVRVFSSRTQMEQRRRAAKDDVIDI